MQEGALLEARARRVPRRGSGQQHCRSATASIVESTSGSRRSRGNELKPPGALRNRASPKVRQFSAITARYVKTGQQCPAPILLAAIYGNCQKIIHRRGAFLCEEVTVPIVLPSRRVPEDAGDGSIAALLSPPPTSVTCRAVANVGERNGSGSHCEPLQPVAELILRVEVLGEGATMCGLWS
jgi:hypothetical protein